MEGQQETARPPAATERRRDLVNAAIVDALPGSVALLDPDGVIRAVNAAWVRFGLERSHDGVLADAGVSYLDITDAAAGADATARAAADAIRSVLRGVVDLAEAEYPADDSGSPEWFTMRAAPVDVDGERWAIVVHEDVTRRHRAESRLARHRELLEIVAGGTPLPEVATAVAVNIGRAVPGATGAVVLGGHGVFLSPGVPATWRASDQWRVPVDPARPSLGDLVIVPGRPVTADDRTGADMLADVVRYALQRDEVLVRTHTRIPADELRTALDDGQIEVHYQPIIDLRSGAAVSLEALVRWTHPRRGYIPPPELIEVAEVCGLIRELGGLVLHTACRDLATFRAGGAEDMTVAVNLSGVQLQEADLVPTVRAALDDAGLEASALMVEVTESVVIDDMDVVAGSLRALRELGVRVAIDDFGTGYSSLLYLQRLPADVLKVDRAFVQGLGVNEGDTAIVEAVVGLAHRLGLDVVAEGVETDDQLMELRRRACDHAQGFLLQRPVPAADLGPLLASGVDLGPAPPAVDLRAADEGGERGAVPELDVGRSVAQTIDDLAPLLTRHDVRLVVEDKARAAIDPVVVRQVITQLLGSAVASTDADDTITVRVRPVEHTVEIAVERDGGALFALRLQT